MTNHTQQRRRGTWGRSLVQKRWKVPHSVGIWHPTLKKHLSRHFTWLTQQERMVYALGMNKLITGCEKLLNYPGYYVENSVPVKFSLYIAHCI
jgi:hypothetical protein